MHSYCIPALTDLARQIEKAPTREAALDAFEQFRLTPASMMLSTDATMVLMQLISKKLVGKRSQQIIGGSQP